MVALGAAAESIGFGLSVRSAGSRQRPQAGDFNWIDLIRPAQTVEPETGFSGDGSRNGADIMNDRLRVA